MACLAGFRQLKARGSLVLACTESCRQYACVGFCRLVIYVRSPLSWLQDFDRAFTSLTALTTRFWSLVAKWGAGALVGIRELK